MKLIKLTADQLKKIEVLEGHLTAVGNAFQKYDRVKWYEKKQKLSDACHNADDVTAAINAVDAYSMHAADEARAESYREFCGTMLNSLLKTIQEEIMIPLLQPILGKASVAAGELAEQTEQNEKAEAEELGIHFVRSPKIANILQRAQNLHEMSEDMTRQAPRRNVLEWLAKHWIAA